MAIDRVRMKCGRCGAEAYCARRGLDLRWEIVVEPAAMADFLHLHHPVTFQYEADVKLGLCFEGMTAEDAAALAAIEKEEGLT